MSDTNIGVILGFIGALFVSLFILWVERKLKKSDKKKEAKEIYKLVLLDKLKEHKTDLIDRLLKKLEHTEIRCHEFNLWRGGEFKVWINGLKELEGEKIYKQAIQHLEAYPDIYELWDASIKKIDGDNGLNDELRELRKYLSDKISEKFKAERDKLHSNIWCIMECAKPSEKIKDSKDLDKVLDGINITIKSKIVYVDSSDGKNLASIHCKEVNVNDVKDFLSDLIKQDAKFREKIKSFTLGYNELNKTFKDFKNKLNGLLQDVDGEEDKFKGDCDRCSSWVKEIG